MAGPGRGLGRPGVGGAGEAAAAQAGRLLPGPERGRAPACPGGGAGAGGGGGRGPGAFLETLAKYSQRIGAFLEMRRRRQPRPVGAEPGVLQTGGERGRERFPGANTRWAGGGTWRASPRGRAGALHRRSRDPSAGAGAQGASMGTQRLKIQTRPQIR
ncbi:hypothetical protein VULLAG_LOCUS10245 [Vulpes lagopus]